MESVSWFESHWREVRLLGNLMQETPPESQKDVKHVRRPVLAQTASFLTNPPKADHAGTDDHSLPAPDKDLAQTASFLTNRPKPDHAGNDDHSLAAPDKALILDIATRIGKLSKDIERQYLPAFETASFLSPAALVRSVSLPENTALLCLLSGVVAALHDPEIFFPGLDGNKECYGRDRCSVPRNEFLNVGLSISLHSL